MLVSNEGHAHINGLFFYCYVVFTDHAVYPDSRVFPPQNLKKMQFPGTSAVYRDDYVFSPHLKKGCVLLLMLNYDLSLIKNVLYSYCSILGYAHDSNGEHFTRR